MANLPALATQPALDKDERLHTAIIDLLEDGLTPNEIAKKMHPNDRLAKRRLRQRIINLAGRDANFIARVEERARVILTLALIPATQALGARVKKTGRPDAVKLLYEAGGFHNPRVKHEHSGEIRVKMDMPRPVPVEEEIVDADVVEESPS